MRLHAETVHVLLGCILSSAMLRSQEPPVPPAQQGEPGREGLEARIRELEQRIERLEAPALAPDATRQSARDEGAALTHTPPGFWRIPGSDYSLRFGGYVKLDAIHDFNVIDNEFKFATQTIAVPTAAASRTTFHARETRLNIDVRGPIGDHESRIFVEGDFFGSGNTFNLRHAFGEVGGFLAGQTWTTYMDLSSRPHTLDFEGPDAELFVRQPMLRYTHGFGDSGSSFSVALESSSQDLSVATGSGFTGSSETPLPDFTSNLRLGGEGQHVQLSGVVRWLEFDGDAGTPDEETIGYGIALSGKMELGDPSRRLMGQVSAGEGSAHYNQALRGSGSDAVLVQGSLEALPLYTFVIGYEHDWSERWTSTVTYSIADLDPIAAQAPTSIDRSQSASVNLVWHPYHRFLAGVEYLWGERSDISGQQGEAHRIQFSFKFLF